MSQEKSKTMPMRFFFFFWGGGGGRRGLLWGFEKVENLPREETMVIR